MEGIKGGAGTILEVRAYEAVGTACVNIREIGGSEAQDMQKTAQKGAVESAKFIMPTHF